MDKQDFRVLLGFLLVMWGDLKDSTVLVVFGIVYVALALSEPFVVSAFRYRRLKKGKQ